MRITVSRRGRGQHGSAALEFLGALPILLLAALMAWQLLLVTFTATAAENAARAASRANGTGGDGEDQGMDALPSWLRDEASVAMSGDQADVTVTVPIVFPGISTDAWTVTRSAEIPSG
jgi:TadE-like protein